MQAGVEPEAPSAGAIRLQGSVSMVDETVARGLRLDCLSRPDADAVCTATATCKAGRHLRRLEGDEPRVRHHG